jgi:hypothetical protein
MLPSFHIEFLSKPSWRSAMSLVDMFDTDQTSHQEDGFAKQSARRMFCVSALLLSAMLIATFLLNFSLSVPLARNAELRSFVAEGDSGSIGRLIAVGGS